MVALNVMSEGGKNLTQIYSGAIDDLMSTLENDKKASFSSLHSYSWTLISVPEKEYILYVSNGEYVECGPISLGLYCLFRVQKNANEFMHYVYAIGQPL